MNFENPLICSQFTCPTDNEVLKLGNLDQGVDDYDFGRILFNTDIEDISDDASCTDINRRF